MIIGRTSVIDGQPLWLLPLKSIGVPIDRPCLRSSLVVNELFLLSLPMLSNCFEMHPTLMTAPGGAEAVAVQPPYYSCNHSFILSFIQILIHSIIHTFVHSLIDHSLVCVPNNIFMNIFASNSNTFIR